ncbi:MAG: inositol monophosphatase, partial [Candidatus Omnitrophica bacterium]|nr:inositol monophosphatase [Candidatus Omnitrophota bacterium]
MDTKTRKDLAITAAKQIGNLLKSNFGRYLRIKNKEDKSLVTHIDLEAEKIIIDLIKQNYPQDGILSEESKEQLSTSGYKWIIDPLDGTHNYIHKIDAFGTSIALAFKEEVILAVLYIPTFDELYCAQKDKGAYLNGKKITVSQRKLKQATLIFDSSIRYQKQTMLSCLSKTATAVFNIRMFGSTARSLCYIA